MSKGNQFNSKIYVINKSSGATALQDLGRQSGRRRSAIQFHFS